MDELRAITNNLFKENFYGKQKKKKEKKEINILIVFFQFFIKVMSKFLKIDY